MILKNLCQSKLCNGQCQWSEKHISNHKQSINNDPPLPTLHNIYKYVYNYLIVLPIIIFLISFKYLTYL
jgi:hypothetical protein